MKRRIFILDEAIAKLPWLELKFQELDEVKRLIDALKEEVSVLLRKSRRNGGGGSDEQIGETQRKIEEFRSQTSVLIDDIMAEGILVRDLNMGLVDFPSFSDGTEILLCWVRGEKTILYWHGVNEGYMSRKRLRHE